MEQAHSLVHMQLDEPIKHAIQSLPLESRRTHLNFYPPAKPSTLSGNLPYQLWTQIFLQAFPSVAPREGRRSAVTSGNETDSTQVHTTSSRRLNKTRNTSSSDPLVYRILFNLTHHAERSCTLKCASGLSATRQNSVMSIFFSASPVFAKSSIWMPSRNATDTYSGSIPNRVFVRM
jgi:hypothetical protein